MGIDNSVVIAGNLGSDPELRYTASGSAVVSFSLAVYAGKDKDAHWFDVTAWQGSWDNLAENTCESLTKGDRVTVFGRIVQDRWETEDGSKRSKVKIVADDVAVSLRRATAQVQRNERRTADDGPPPQRPAPSYSEEPF